MQTQFGDQNVKWRLDDAGHDRAQEKLAIAAFSKIRIKIAEFAIQRAMTEPRRQQRNIIAYVLNR